MKFILIVSVLFVLCLLTQNQNSYSQLPWCPPDGPEWSDITGNGSELDPSFTYMEPDYKRRQNNGRIEIVIDWASWIDGNYPNVPLNSRKDFMQYLIVLGEAESIQEDVTVAVIYKTDCYANAKCVIRLKPNNEIACCDNQTIHDLVAPQIYTWNQQSVFNVYHQVICGYRCCEKVYTLVYNPNAQLHQFHHYVSNVVTQSYENLPCTSTLNLFDCLNPTQPLPCEGGCE